MKCVGPRLPLLHAITAWARFLTITLVMVAFSVSPVQAQISPSAAEILQKPLSRFILLYTPEGYSALRKILYTDALNRGKLPMLERSGILTHARIPIHEFTPPRLRSSMDALQETLQRPGWEKVREHLVEELDTMDRLYNRAISLDVSLNIKAPAGRNLKAEKAMQFSKRRGRIIRSIAEMQFSELKWVEELSPRISRTSGQPLTASTSPHLSDRSLKNLEQTAVRTSQQGGMFPAADLPASGVSPFPDLSKELLPHGVTRAQLIPRAKQMLADFTSCYRNMPLIDRSSPSAKKLIVPESNGLANKISQYLQNNPGPRQLVNSAIRGQLVTLTGFTIGSMRSGGVTLNTPEEFTAFMLKLRADAGTSAINNLLKQAINIPPGPIYIRWSIMLIYDIAKSRWIDAVIYRLDPKSNLHDLPLEEAVDARLEFNYAWNVLWSPVGLSVTVLAQGLECAFPGGKVIAGTNLFQFFWGVGTSMLYFSLREHHMESVSHERAESMAAKARLP